jgi:hypothetical protein
MNGAPFWFQSFENNSIKVFDGRTNMEAGYGTVDGAKATLDIFGGSYEVTSKDGNLIWSDGDVWGAAGNYNYICFATNHRSHTPHNYT